MAGRRKALLLSAALLLALVMVWDPILRPGSKAAVILLDVYSTSLTGNTFAGLVTPPPRVVDTQETLAGVVMRVTWWRPGWGDRHPGILLVNGATPSGNDLKETRLISGALARAGFLVMLPEFPLLKEDRFDPAAVEQIDDAFARLRAHPASRSPTGAYGFSVGGGILLAAAGQGSQLARADYIGVLGAYYDIRTYLASVVSGKQLRGGELGTWAQSEDARRRAPLAATEIVGDPADRRRLADEIREKAGVLSGDAPSGMGEEATALRRALSATGYEEALRRLEELPAPALGRLERLSPRVHWSGIKAPVYWLHDAGDHYVPLAQAEAALAETPRGKIHLVTPRLLAHGEPIRKDPAGSGLLFWVSELWGLLRFAIEVLRVAS
jgi:dienelactone hydrolase